MESVVSPSWRAEVIPMSALVDEPSSAGSGTSDNTFRWDPVGQQYIYNWSTKGVTAGYWYRLSAKLDDGKIYTVTVGVR